jgi:PAS domain S-box-containing protein
VSGSRRVLIVEDENIVAMDIARGLRRMAYEVTGIASSAQDALSLLEDCKPDLVLMDIQIRGPIDGIELAERVRKEHGIPVVFLTAHADDRTLERAKGSGPYGYVLKPFDETELHTALVVALQKHENVVRDQRASRARIEAGEQSLKLALDAAQMGAWDWDIRAGTTQMDAKCRELLGYEPGASATRGRRFEKVHPDDLRRVEDEIDRAIRDRIEYRCEFRVLWPDGSCHWIAGCGRAFYDPVTDAPTRMAGLVAEVTERKVAEQRLLEALRTRDEFFSIASHELKTPVTSIKYQLEMIERLLRRSDDARMDPARIVSMLKSSSQQLDRLNRLVDDMLDVSRIQVGTLKIEKRSFDLASMVRELAARMEGTLRESRCQVSIDADGEVTGTWDQLRIEQVVTNLLTNAAKYAAGCPVKVSVGKRGETAYVLVSDRGRGIPSDALERIFERFERAVDASDTSGLGLGLYIANQIVRRHGGRIQVESRLGEGATFKVELPIRDGWIEGG